MRLLALLLLLPALALADEAALAKKRWSESPHGPMLERILPPTFEARQLPEPGSPGAQLTLQYCLQCHNLPNPAMHHVAKWPGIVERMVPRMQGKGNMGKLMFDMMAGVTAPNPDEVRQITAYLRKHAQKPLDPKKYPEAFTPAGEPFRLACNQCHTLPDRSATRRRSGPRWWRACRRTWSG